MITYQFRRAVEAVVAKFFDNNNGHAHTGVVGQGPVLSNTALQIPWTAWTPSYGGSGSMTFTSVTTTMARYAQIGKTVVFQLSATGTTGGTASGAIYFDLPVTPAAGAGGLAWAGYCLETGSIQIGATGVNYPVAGRCYVSRYDAANFGLGAGRQIAISGCYEAA